MSKYIASDEQKNLLSSDGFCYQRLDEERKIKEGDALDLEYFPIFNKKQNGIYSAVIRHFCWNPLFFIDTIVGKYSSRGSVRHLGHLFKGLNFAFREAWPPIFLGLLMYDMVVFFAEPSRRYGTVFSQLLLGTADSEWSVTSHLGSDLVNEWKYHVWPGLIGVGCLSAMALFAVSRRQLNEWKGLDDDNRKIIGEAFEDGLERLDQAMGVADEETYFSLLSEKIYAAVSMNFWSSLIDRYFLKRFFADAIYHEPVSSLSRDHFLRVLKSDLNLHQRKLYPGWFYVQYLLWSVGENRSPAAQIFWLIPLFSYYSAIRLAEIFIFKLKGLVDYFTAKHACEREGRVWQYLAQFGNNFCTACGDLSFMYIGDIFDVDRCWEGLFRANRTLSQLNAGIDRLMRKQRYHPDTLDLSHQNWGDWTESEFEGFLQKVGGQLQALKTFNLSQSVVHYGALDDQKIKSLVAFMEMVPTVKIDLHNVGVGNEGIKTLISSLNKNITNYLDFSGNFLTDDSVPFLNETLFFSIKNLNLANNVFGQVVLDQLSLLIQSPLSNLIDINLSSNNFFTQNFDLFWKSNQNRLLPISLDLSNCSLVDMHLILSIPYLEKTALHKIKFANNGVTNTGVNYFINGLASISNMIVELDFTKNRITDLGVNYFSRFLPKTKLQTLWLGQNGLTSSSLSSLLKVLPQTTICNVFLEKNHFGDEGIRLLGQFFNEKSNKIKRLDVSGNEITDRAGSCFIQLLNKSSLIDLNMADNNLGDQSATMLSKILPGSKIERINFNNNQITPIGGNALISALKDATIKVLDLGSNPAGKKIGEVLTTALIQQPIPYLSLHALEDTNPTLDQRRALHNKAKPQALFLKTLNISNTTLEKDAIEMICRVMPQTNYSPQSIILSDNFFEGVDLENCQISSGSILKPFQIRSPLSFVSAHNDGDSISTHSLLVFALSGGAMPLILTLMSFYILYRAIKPVVSEDYQYPRFFKSVIQPKTVKNNDSNNNFNEFKHRAISECCRDTF